MPLTNTLLIPSKWVGHPRNAKARARPKGTLRCFPYPCPAPRLAINEPSGSPPWVPGYHVRTLTAVQSPQKLFMLTHTHTHVWSSFGMAALVRESNTQVEDMSGQAFSFLSLDCLLLPSDASYEKGLYLWGITSPGKEGLQSLTSAIQPLYLSNPGSCESCIFR